MKKKKVFVCVESPFQLLCAKEFLIERGLQYVIFARALKGLHYTQMKEAAIFLKLNNVEFFNLKFFHLFIVVKLFLSALVKREWYLLGDVNGRFLKIFSIFLPKKKVVFLDDGVATIFHQEKVHKHIVKYPYNFYTIFDIKAFKSQKIYINKLSYIKGLITGCFSKCELYVSSGLVERNIISIADYIFVLRQVASLNEGKLLYVAHRVSSKCVLDQVSAIPGISVVRPNVPIEIFLIVNRMKPSKMYSITSTSFFSLNLIFEDMEIVVVKPKSSGFLGQPLLYDYLNKCARNIKVITY